VDVRTEALEAKKQQKTTKKQQKTTKTIKFLAETAVMA
jgi:hypothetical protein